ncbi:MAG: hypothetical protein ACE5KG_02215 [Nitrososphaerales archaeon]
MVNVRVERDAVVFELRRMQKFYAMKGNLRIPFKSIKRISTDEVKLLGLARRLGTNVPKIFNAGTFWTKEGKSFWYVRNRSKCITLELMEHEYWKVVIEVDDKVETAGMISNELSKQ